MTSCIPAYFDSAQFDFSYFDITDCRFGAMVENHEDMLDFEGELVTFIRVDTDEDVMGVVTDSSETRDEGVRVKFQPLSEEDRKLVGRGVSKEGSAKIYAKRAYDLTNNGDSTRIECGDIIVRTNDGTDSRWRVESINRYFAFNGEVYRRCILKRIEA